MTAKRTTRQTAPSAKQRADHNRIRNMFREWHPSPEELIAGGEGAQFSLSGEYPYLRPFLAQLKAARERAGLSLADVSRRCGIDKAALSRLENGQNPNPTLDTLWRYAAAVGKRLLLDAEEIATSHSALKTEKQSTRRNGNQVGGKAARKS